MAEIVEHDAFCDCQTCLDAQVATIQALTNNAPVVLDLFADQMDTETEAPEVPALTICRKCHRPLTSARSIREAGRNGGYGRGCARKIDQVAKAKAGTDQPAQVAKAVELIEDGGLDRTSKTTWLAVSSDGTTRYEVNTQTGLCGCPAGQHGRRCYHQISVEIVTGAPTATPLPTAA